MDTSDKCPRCDCEGNEVACEICFYYNFRCPGNCKCCEGQRETSTQRQARLTISSGRDHTESIQRQARTTSGNDQTDSNQRQEKVTCCMDQKKAYAKREKRAPVRPLILRNVKKSIADSQKQAGNSVFHSKAEDSTINESSTKEVDAEAQATSSMHKVTYNANSADHETKPNKVKASALEQQEKPKFVKSSVFEQQEKPIVKAEAQITSPQYEVPQYEAPQYEAPQHEAPQHKVTLLDEQDIQQLPFLKEFLIKEDQELERQWNRIFWPQWDKLPCEPHNSSETENERENLSIIKEKLLEKNKKMIGDHCLNCQCRHPKESCDICKLSNFQCLGTCLCCQSFRFGQRVMIFITHGIFQLHDGRFFGGGNVSM